jgi:UDP-GlcNAc:undecaprenyl-phosphate GlcNAc-1-phosphate transferase
MRDYAEAFGIACIASIVFTFVTRAVARRFSLTAKPRVDRWHRRPTALYGGVGIFGAFLLAIWLGPGTLGPEDHLAGGTLLVACSSAMFLLGLVDDAVQLKPQAKLVVQIAIATLFTMYGMRLHWLASPVLDQGLTVFWLVGITNALNLLDNIDGAAAGVALIASSFIAVFSLQSGNADVALIATCFAGAVLGFLFFNFNPASIFMGDSGSLFLGFFLAGVSMVNRQAGARRTMLTVLIMPVLLLLIPILDTTLVTLSRSFHGRRVSQGGRDHTSHRLVALGMSERAAALTLWCLSVLAGALALLAQTLSQAVLVLLVPLFVISVLFFFILLGRVRVYEPVDSDAHGGGRALLPTLHDFAYKRRVFEVLSDSAIVGIAYYGGYVLRFDGAIVQPYHEQVLRSLPLVVATQLGAFLIFGLYRSVWRYTSARDLPIIIRSVAGGWLLSVATLAIAYRLQALSRAAIVIDLLLLSLLIPLTRVAFRWFQPFLARSKADVDTSLRRVFVYGAGDAGELLVRELMNNLCLGFLPVAFIDDDRQKHGRNIHGVPVLGAIDVLDVMLGKHGVDALIVSTVKLTEDVRKQLHDVCRARQIAPLELRVSIQESAF